MGFGNMNLLTIEQKEGMKKMLTASHGGEQEPNTEKNVPYIYYIRDDATRTLTQNSCVMARS